MVQLTRPQVFSMLILVVSVAIAGASLGYAQKDNHMIELKPASGCPGTEVVLTASLPFQDGFVAPAKVATGTAAPAADGWDVKIMTDPDGLMSLAFFELTINEGIDVRGAFTVSDSVCAGPYTVTISLLEDSHTVDSVSAVFVVGGEGCPRLGPCRPVGGVVMPVNMLAVTAPYLALAGLIVAVSAVVVIKRRRD